MTDRRPRMRWRPLLGAALLFGLWVVTLLELRELFAGGIWTLRALASAAVVVLGAGAVQAVRPRQRALAWLLGAMAGAGLLVWWMQRDARLSGWLGQPLGFIQETWIVISDGVPPLEPAGALLDVVLSAWFVGLLLSSLLLTRFGLFFAAGVVPALLMLAPATVTSLRIPPPLLLCAGALLLLLLWAGSPPTVGRWRGIASAGLALALAAGLIAALPLSRDRVWNSAAVSVSPVSSTVPDVTIALAEDLRARSNTIAFEYRGSVGGDGVGGSIARFTLAVLSDFERGTWLPEDQLDVAGGTVGSGLPATSGEVAAPVGPLGADPSITVRTKGLLSSWLPLPQQAERVEAISGSFDPSRWVWVDGTSTARSETALTRPGDEYRVVTGVPARDQFGRPVGPPLEPGEVPDLDRYLELPDGIPASIADAAREATAGPPVAGERSPGAVRLEAADGTVTWTTINERGAALDAEDRGATAALLAAWFRSGAFTYDERAPYEPGADPDDPYAVMESFLEQRSGYCVHFASTYAVMARSLGIPSRVAVGYVSRSRNTGWTPVRARELHAWPEVYIDGAGWVPFEPTPGGAGYRAETGLPDQDEPGPGSEAPEPTDAPDPAAPTEEQPELPTDLDDPDAAGDQGTDAPSDRGIAALPGIGILIVFLGLLLGLLCLTPAVREGRRLIRRRRMRRGEAPATQAWLEFIDTAIDLGLYAPASSGARARTPEAVAEHLEVRGLLGDDGRGSDAARSLARAVVEERYAGAPLAGVSAVPDLLDSVLRDGAAPDAEPSLEASPPDAAPILEALETATRALGARAGWRARLRAAALPRSVTRR